MNMQFVLTVNYFSVIMGVIVLKYELYVEGFDACRNVQRFTEREREIECVY